MWRIHKFGGTSVADAEKICRCVKIIKDDFLCSGKHIAVVVSALGGNPKITDLLLNTAKDAASGKWAESMDTLQLIKMRHYDCVDGIHFLSQTEREKLKSVISADINELTDILKAIQLLKSSADQFLELISGYGELWSARIMTSIFNEDAELTTMFPPSSSGNGCVHAVFVDARDIIIVGTSRHDKENVKVHWNISQTKLNQLLDSFCHKKPKFLVVTGFIASTIDGAPTTLRRDGSDFTAAILAKLIHADSVTIWSDVNGIFTADPRIVPHAKLIKEMSYNEAIELSYFGAKVLHPKTVAPVVALEIPIFIRNSFAPSIGGTRIGKRLEEKDRQKSVTKLVCGFSTVAEISLLSLEGTGMIGVPGIAGRLFDCLKLVDVSVLLISQSSSEHSISFAIKTEYVNVAKSKIEEVFYYEFQQGFVSAIKSLDNCSIVAAIGDEMSNSPGIAGMFFTALGSCSINVLAIAQGCDERNISAVVSSWNATKALRALHSAFFPTTDAPLFDHPTSNVINLAIAIDNNFEFNARLLELLFVRCNNSLQRPSPQQRSGSDPIMIFNFDLRALMCNSGILLLQPDQHMSLNDLQSLAEQTSRSNDLLKAVAATTNSGGNNSNKFFAMNTSEIKLLPGHLKQKSRTALILDLSDSDIFGYQHGEWLKRGIHVVSANINGLAGDDEVYADIVSATTSNDTTTTTAKEGSAIFDWNLALMRGAGAHFPLATFIQNSFSSKWGEIKMVQIVFSSSINKLLCRLAADDSYSLCAYLEEKASTIIASRKKCRERIYDKNDEDMLLSNLLFGDLNGTLEAKSLVAVGRALGFSIDLTDVEIVSPIARDVIIKDIENRKPKELSNLFSRESEALHQRKRHAAASNCLLQFMTRIESDDGWQQQPKAIDIIPPNINKKSRSPLFKYNSFAATAKIEEIPTSQSCPYIAVHTTLSNTPIVIQCPPLATEEVFSETVIDTVLEVVAMISKEFRIR